MELTRNDIGGPVLYSANFGGAEPIRDLDTSQSLTTVLFTDQAVTGLKNWDCIVHIPSDSLVATPRRAARYLKLNPHLLFPSATISIWADATHNPAVDLITLRHYLKYADIACFKHPIRTTARQEAAVCKEQQLDDPALIDAAIEFYNQDGFRDTQGLYGTACVVRRHNLQTASLNALWWYGCNRWTHRDQVILPWALWRLEMVPACLQGTPRTPGATVGVATQPNPYFNVTIW